MVSNRYGQAKGKLIHPLLASSAVLCLLASLLTGPTAHALEERFSPSLLQGLEWRFVGPYRGGRSTAVAGVVQDPSTFYFGSTGGGLWKTTDAGISWKNVSDGHFATGSVGAVAVAPSDSNVLYVGMGEAPVRGVATSHGDGVYKSTDAGETFTHLGLEKTRQISRILVHPTDPKVVWIAAQGATGEATEERGIYKSTDGGQTFRKVLFVSRLSGASDLAYDVTNPRILFAAFWQHQRKPWTIESGGVDSGLHKSTDGGETWVKLTGGLPEFAGKIGVAVSPANPQRVWTIVEAEEGGLFRSDDGGDSFKRVNSERVLRARAWYYTHVTADPLDANTVYVMNAPLMKSTDGGKTFLRVPTPHGDNHALWIHPDNNRLMINANDGGANISSNAGTTWSTQTNQPTAQMYRVITDRRFPYYLYGGQQDNSTVAIASRSDSGGIGRDDWYSVGGCESAHIAFDPDDPRRVYAGCYQGLISEWSADTKRERSVMAHEFLGLGTDPIDQPYRFNWNAPIVASPHDPETLYHAGNHVLETKDRGNSWRQISPDLTRNEKDKQGPGGGPITNEAAGGENYNTLLSLAVSEHREGVLWAGSDDGLIHLTQDHGATWTNITPPQAGVGMVNTIELSPHDAATAYVAFTRYKFNDFSPHIFRTTDYGKTWRDMAQGLPEEAFVRAVREDTERPGLLFAGTETGLFVSFDDGTRWQSLQLKLPVVPITDLRVHGSDLVAATQGRGFWILDDITPLRQLEEPLAEAALVLLQPNTSLRLQGGGRPDELEAKNPKNGVYFHYILSEEVVSANEQDAPSVTEPDHHLTEGEGDEDSSHQAELTLEISTLEGESIRTFSSIQDDAQSAAPTPGRPSEPKTLPFKEGLNRFVWDFTGEQLRKIPDQFVFGSLSGYRVAPGTYSATLRLGDLAQTQTFEIVEDPRVSYDQAGYALQQSVLSQIASALNDMHQSVVDFRSLRRQLDDRAALTDGHSEAARISAARDAAQQAIDTWEDHIVQKKQETFQDVINFHNRLNARWISLMSTIDQSGPPVTQGAQKRLDELQIEWDKHKAERQAVLDGPIKEFNQLFDELAIPAIILPTEAPEGE